MVKPNHYVCDAISAKNQWFVPGAGILFPYRVNFMTVLFTPGDSLQARGLAQFLSTVREAISHMRSINKASLAGRISTLVVALAVLLPGTGLFAQGTMNQLPDPISSKEFVQLLNRHVKPTFEQWGPIEDARDAYLDSFKELRDGAIARFLEESTEMQSGTIPTRAAVEEFLRDLARVENLIRGVDDALLNSVLSILREDQYAALERARQTRQRMRMSSGVLTSSMGSGFVYDLWTAVDSASITDADLARIDHVLLDYEQKLTRLMSDLHRKSSNAMLVLIEELEKHDPADLEAMTSGEFNQELMERVMASMQVAYSKSLEETSRISARVRSLNQRSLQLLCDALDTRSARRLKVSFDPRDGMYFIMNRNDLSFNFSRDLVSRIDRVLEHDSLTPDMRERITTIADRYISEHHRLLDKKVGLLTAYDPAATMVDSMSFDPANDLEESPGALIREKIEKNQSEHKALRVKYEKEVSNVLADLGQRDRETLYVILVHGWSDDEHAPKSTMEVGVAGSTAMIVSDPPSSRGWVLQPISVVDLARIRRLIEIEDWQIPVLEALHEEYLADWGKSVLPLKNQSMELVSSYMDVASDKKAYESRVDTASNLLVSAVESAMKIDRDFFENIQHAVREESTPVVSVLALEREHQANLGSGSMRGWFGQFSSNDKVSPISVLLDLELESQERDAVVAHILATADPMLEASKACFQLQLSLKKDGELQERLFYERANDFSEDGSVVVESSVVGDVNAMNLSKTNQLERLLREASIQDEAFVSGLREILAESTLERYLVDFRVARYPEVYLDRTNIKATFQDVFSMRDLDDDQLVKIGKLESEYVARWEELSESMVESAAELEQIMHGVMAESIEHTGYMDLMARRERAEYERVDLADRTLRRVARVLNSVQRSRLPSLSAIDAEMGASVVSEPSDN